MQNLYLLCKENNTPTTYMYMYMYVHVLSTHVYTQIHLHIHTHTNNHVYTHTHTHTLYTQDQLRRQQQLLQGFQTSQDTASSSVFISPAITLELSGVSFGHAATEGANSLGHEYGPPPLQVYIIYTFTPYGIHVYMYYMYMLPQVHVHVHMPTYMYAHLHTCLYMYIHVTCTVHVFTQKTHAILHVHVQVMYIPIHMCILCRPHILVNHSQVHHRPSFYNHN